MIDDHGIGDHGVDGVFGDALGLTHSIPDHFAATKFHFFSVDRKIVLDFDK